MALIFYASGPNPVSQVAVLQYEDRMSRFDTILDFYRWWGWELRQMLPASLLRRDTPAELSIRVRRAGLLVEPGRAGLSFEPFLVDGSPDGARELAAAFGNRRNLKADVLFESERFLKRQLSPLRLPVSRAAAMAAIDCRASTPLDPAQSELVAGPYDPESPATVYYIVSKSHLQPVRQTLSEARIAVARIGVLDGGKFVDAPTLMNGVGSGSGRIQQFAQAATVALATGVLAVFGLLYWQYSSANAEIDQQLAALNKEVSAIRAAIDTRNRQRDLVAAMRAQKQGAIPVAAVLNELARVIPDGTWLTDINIRDNTILFTGISSSAASLIPVLEKSSIFSNPTFTQAVVRAVEQTGEKFSISMNIEKPNG